MGTKTYDQKESEFLISKSLNMSRALACWEPEAYSESCQTSMIQHFAKMVNGIVIFANHDSFHNVSFSPSALYEINMILLK